MGTRVLTSGSAVAAFVQKSTEPPSVAVPPVPVVARVYVGFVHSDVGVVCVRISSWLSGIAGAPLGAL